MCSFQSMLLWQFPDTAHSHLLFHATKLLSMGMQTHPRSASPFLLSPRVFERAESIALRHIRSRIKLFIEPGCYHIAH